AVLEHAAAPARNTVETPRNPHRPALDAPRPRLRASRLADHVHVVALDRELADPELALLAAVDERAAQDPAELELAQLRHVPAHPHGDEHGKPRVALRPGPVA